MTAQPTGRRPGPRRALHESDILDAALALLDEGGAPAASIRGIAARVGVTPNAVYTYFPDKTAVVRALVERMFAGLADEAAASPGRPWRDRVETLALALRARLTAHPGAVPLMLGGPMDGPHALALNERLLEILGAAGLDADDAARACYLLITYVFGSLALEAAEAQAPGPLPPEGDRVAARLAGGAAVPADRFPRTAAAARAIAGYVSTGQYLWGLHRLLDGVAAGSRGS